MPTSTAVFWLLIENQNEADVVNYTAIIAARVLSWLMKKGNNSKQGDVFHCEQPLRRKRLLSAEQAGLLVEEKGKQHVHSLHLFPKGGERGRKQRISKDWHQSREANRTDTSIPRLRTKQSRQ